MSAGMSPSSMRCGFFFQYPKPWKSAPTPAKNCPIMPPRLLRRGGEVDACIHRSAAPQKSSASSDGA
ncbi:hypothetical protein ACFPRL_14435 [Pseudoclavibacter helvolus]